MTAVQSPQLEPILTHEGPDGVMYGVRPFAWTWDKAEHFFDLFVKYRILSDEVIPTVEGFLGFVMQPGALWFEIYSQVDDSHVGFLYLTDMVPSRIENRFISASWHGTVWDAQALPRRPIARAFIEWAFQTFKLHRMQALIPLKFGGAIRTAKKLGFKEEGVLRSARRFDGKWFGVLLLSILEEEVGHG